MARHGNRRGALDPVCGAPIVVAVIRAAPQCIMQERARADRRPGRIGQHNSTTQHRTTTICHLRSYYCKWSELDSSSFSITRMASTVDCLVVVVSVSVACPANDYCRMIPKRTIFRIWLQLMLYYCPGYTL